MDITALKLNVQILCSIISVVGSLLFIILCKPLRISKRLEDRMFCRLCLLTALFGAVNIVRDLQYGFGFFKFYTIWGVLALYFPDLVFLFYVLVWRLFVDGAINGSYDRIKFKLKNAILPFGIMFVLLGFVYYLVQAAQRDIMSTGAVSARIDRIFEIWGLVYYILSMAIVIFYLIESFVNLHSYYKNRKQPLFLRLDVFIIPWIVGIICQNIPPAFIVIDSLCAFISLMLTYWSMRKRFKFLDIQTDFYREDFIPFLEQYAKKNNFDRVCSVILITGNDFHNTAAVIRKNRPTYSVVIEMNDGTFIMVSAIRKESAFMLLDICMKETARQEYADLRIESKFFIKDVDETLDKFTGRVLSESGKSA